MKEKEKKRKHQLYRDFWSLRKQAVLSALFRGSRNQILSLDTTYKACPDPVYCRAFSWGRRHSLVNHPDEDQYEVPGMYGPKRRGQQAPEHQMTFPTCSLKPSCPSCTPASIPLLTLHPAPFLSTSGPVPTLHSFQVLFPF